MLLIGAVTLSPPGNSFNVCNGDQLELICSLTGHESSLMEWVFTPEIIYMGLFRALDANGQIPSSFTINSTQFAFSRISPRNHKPLISKLLISPLTADLNGTVVNCTDVIRMESATAIVYVRNIHSGTSC